jgi:hypothetical protein
VLIVCDQMHTLLHDGSCSVMLQVEQVLGVLGHRSHADVEVQALEVRHGLNALLPHWVFLILNQEKHDRHHGDSGKVTLTQRGECDVCRLLDGDVRLVADDGSHPRLCRVDGYHHVGHTYVQAVNHRQLAAVDRNFPAVAE